MTIIAIMEEVAAEVRVQHQIGYWLGQSCEDIGESVLRRARCLLTDDSVLDGRRRNRIRAAALLIAEIERQDRATQPGATP